MRILLVLLIFLPRAALGDGLPIQAEGLPDYLVARIQVRDRFLAELPPSTHGFAPQFVIETLKRWVPGTTVRVAFNGGDNGLREKVAEAAGVWLSHGNIKLDFGHNPATGTYRSWSTADAQRAADIRISFNQRGYWSLIGRDSDDPSVAGPGEASMNFGGFTAGLPADYAAVVAHEFGHAFGFQHEHQSPVGGCDSQFRWSDDPNYEPTRDSYGQFIADANGRRPGLYTVLGGPPNNWPASEVDFNLKQLPNTRAFTVGPFDSHSIMMYAFPDWMFVSSTSSCYTPENLTLSAQDIVGFARTYPSLPTDITSTVSLFREFSTAVMNSPTLPAQAKAPYRTLLESLPDISHP